MNVTIWTLQVVCAVAFLASGTMKSLMSKDRMIATGSDRVAPFPLPVLRVVAVSASCSGVAGLLLPQATGTASALTPVAAGWCLAVLMVGAAVAHSTLHEFKQVAFVNAPLFAALVLIAAYRVAQPAEPRPPGYEARDDAPQLTDDVPGRGEVRQMNDQPDAGHHDERAALAVFETHRPHLMGVAYRILGSVVDADDVLQEAWLRWSNVDRATVRSPEAFLTTVVGRLALDHLRRVKAKREAYTGPWLPEPIAQEPDPGHDPAAAVELADSLSMALLVVLETLSPLERGGVRAPRGLRASLCGGGGRPRPYRGVGPSARPPRSGPGRRRPCPLPGRPGDPLPGPGAVPGRLLGGRRRAAHGGPGTGRGHHQ